MADTRRQFLKRGSLLLGEAVVLIPLGSAAVASATPMGTGRLTPVKKVESFLSRCGITLSGMRGGSVLGAKASPACIHMVGVVASPADIFSRMVTDLPFGQPFVQGNTLSFAEGTVSFQIDIVTPDGFRQLRSRLAAGGGIRFAHQALLRTAGENSPAAKTIFDPFGVLKPRGRRLRLVGPEETTAPGRVATILSGIMESALYGLPMDPGFMAFREGVLAGTPATAADATAIADEMTASAALLSCHGGPGMMTRLLTSPLISASMEHTFGRTGRQIAGTAATLRGRGTGAPGAPWLAGILGKERLNLKQGSVWIEHNDRFAFLQSRAALAQARELTAPAI